MSAIELNQQQTKILACVDLTIGIGSLIAVSILGIVYLHGHESVTNLLDVINHPNKQQIYVAIFVLLLVYILAEIAMASLMLMSLKKNKEFPLRRVYLFGIKVFLFIVCLSGVITLLYYKCIIAAFMGALILKYKLYSFWVLWSVPKDYFLTPENSDKVFITGLDL